MIFTFSTRCLYNDHEREGREREKEKRKRKTERGKERGGEEE